MTRDQLAASTQLYTNTGTIHSLLHFVWFCGFRRVTFVGCDGPGPGPAAYDPRLANRSASARPTTPASSTSNACSPPCSAWKPSTAARQRRACDSGRFSPALLVSSCNATQPQLFRFPLWIVTNVDTIRSSEMRSHHGSTIFQVSGHSSSNCRNCRSSRNRNTLPTRPRLVAGRSAPCPAKLWCPLPTFCEPLPLLTIDVTSPLPDC